MQSGQDVSRSLDAFQGTWCPPHALEKLTIIGNVPGQIEAVRKTNNVFL